LNLSCHPNDVVLALKLPAYTNNLTAKEMENASGSNFDDNTKVCCSRVAIIIVCFLYLIYVKCICYSCVFNLKLGLDFNFFKDF